MTTFLAALSSKLITALIGALVGWFAKMWHTFMLKKAAEKSNAEAINKAGDTDDTSGIFDGHSK